MHMHWGKEHPFSGTTITSKQTLNFFQLYAGNEHDFHDIILLCFKEQEEVVCNYNQGLCLPTKPDLCMFSFGSSKDTVEIIGLQ